MKLIIHIFTILLFSFSLNASAKITEVVNVLTWPGYLDNPKTAKIIKKKCGVALSYDTYISNENMLRRWRSRINKYDILIFSYTIYNSIKNEIILKSSMLWKKSNDYHPDIRKKYLNGHFPRNIVYFSHALTGFLWNPRIINLKKEDTVNSAFLKAGNNRIILLDDPVEVAMLLTVSNKKQFDEKIYHIASSDFNAMVKKSKVYIGNEENNLYNRANFAFAYQWSGVALTRNNESAGYHFLIDKSLSYISTDLIAQVNDDKNIACVANYLAGKEFLTDLQNESKYFSPYGNTESIPMSEFKLIYEEFIKNISQLHWLDPPTSAQLAELNREWGLIKYGLLQSG